MNNLIAISNVRANLPNLVERVSDELDRVIITVKGQPKAILMSAEELETLEETAEVMAINGAKTSVKQGLKEAKDNKGIPLSLLK